MYEVFGEFDSAEEINEAVEGLFNEGDNENILVLAKENGIDEEIAQAYITGEIPYMTDYMMAAVGKIEMERNEIEDPFFKDMKDDMINYLVTSSTDEIMARAIRKKGKSLKSCFDYCKKEIEKALNKSSGGLRDRVVYGMEKDYYLKED